MVVCRCRPALCGRRSLNQLSNIESVWARPKPVGLIHIDAHTDTWGPFQGCKFHHGAPFRFAVEDGVLDPKRTVQIGIRGSQDITDGWDFSEQTGMRVIFHGRIHPDWG